jgi:hypothetical protein
MAEPASQQSLKRVWIWALAFIIAALIVYVLTGGPSTPPSPTAADSVAEPR